MELLGPVPEIILWYLLTMVFDAVLPLTIDFKAFGPFMMWVWSLTTSSHPNLRICASTFRVVEYVSVP